MNRSPAKTNNIAADFGVLGWFLLLGAVSGLLFALLVSTSSLQSFFFVKGDKFLIPRYSYWRALSLIQLIGLSGAYVVCVARRLVTQRISPVRLATAALIIGLATPALRALTPLMNSRIGLDWDFVAAPLAFLFLLSVALCVVSGNLKWLPLAIVWTLFFAAIGVGIIYVCVRMVGPDEYYTFVQWPVLFAMFGLSFASWLIWRRLWNSKRVARVTLPVRGAEVREFEFTEIWDINGCRPPCCPFTLLFETPDDGFVYVESWNEIERRENLTGESRLGIESIPTAKRAIKLRIEGQTRIKHTEELRELNEFFEIKGDAQWRTFNKAEMPLEVLTILEAARMDGRFST